MEDVKRECFVFYRSFKESMEELSDTDKLIMYEAISDYSLDGKEPVLTGFPKALFKIVQPILDANINRWRNGKKGGAPKGNRNNKFCTTETQPKNNRSTTEVQPKYNQNTTKAQPNKESKGKSKGKSKNEDKIEMEKSIVVEESTTNKSETGRFVKPTIQEIASFISSNSIAGVDAERFFNYYEANGWKVGRNPMKDWKAAVRTWQRNSRESGKDTGIILRDNSIDKFKDVELW